MYGAYASRARERCDGKFGQRGGSGQIDPPRCAPGHAACGWAEACGCVDACGGSGHCDSDRFTVTEVGFSSGGCGLATTFGFGLGFALGFSGSAAASFCSGMAWVTSGSAAGWWPSC
jgi:hypothetical protein